MFGQAMKMATEKDPQLIENTDSSAREIIEKYDFHPVAKLFPMMDERERAGLVESIKTHGLEQPILLAIDPADGLLKIADGRNRYLACLDAGINPEFDEWNGQGSLLDKIYSLNYHRRNLSASQRAMVAAEYANMKRGDNPQNCGLVSQSTAAEMFNVSVRNIQHATKVHKQGVPELIEKVEKGEMSVDQAARIARMPKQQQKQLIKRGRIAAKRRITKLKTLSLRQTAKGLGTCVHCNPELVLTDQVISAFVQRLEQRCKEAKKAGRTDRDYGSFFEDIAFQLAEEMRAAAVRHNYDKILAVIDGSSDRDDQKHQYAERTDIQRITKISWPEFNETIAVMIDLRMIQANTQGGKTDVARGGRKILYSRVPEAEERELTYDLNGDGDDPPDVYDDHRWD